MDPKLLNTLLWGGGGAAAGALGGGGLSSAIKGDEDETPEERNKRIRDSAVVGALLGGVGGASVPLSSIITGGVDNSGAINKWLSAHGLDYGTSGATGLGMGRFLLGGHPTLTSIGRSLENTPASALKNYVNLHHNQPGLNWTNKKLHNIVTALKLFMGKAKDSSGVNVAPYGFRYTKTGPKILGNKGTGLVGAGLGALLTALATHGVFNSQE